MYAIKHLVGKVISFHTKKCIHTDKKIVTIGIISGGGCMHTLILEDAGTMPHFLSDFCHILSIVYLHTAEIFRPVDRCQI